MKDFGTRTFVAIAPAIYLLSSTGVKKYTIFVVLKLCGKRKRYKKTSFEVSNMPESSFATLKLKFP